MVILKYALLLLFFLACNVKNYAQKPNRNNLYKELIQTQQDSAKAVVLNTIAKTFVRENSDSAKYFFHQSIILSTKINAHLLTVNSLSYQSMNYAMHGELDSAKQGLLQAVKICTIHKLDSALYQNYFGLGNITESLGNLTESLTYYIKALKYFESKNQNLSINRTKANMSYIFIKIGDLEQALKLITESNIFYQTTKATRQLMNGYSRLATLYDKKHNLDSSLHYNDLAIEIADSLGAFTSLNKVRMNKANALFNNRRYKEASNIYQSVISYFESKSSKYNDLLNAYSNMMISMKVLKKDSLSNIYKQKANTIFPQVKKYKVIVGYYHKKFMLDSINNNAKGAIENYQKYVALKDSLFNIEKSKQLTELQTKYETEKITTEKILAENRAELAESESRQNLTLFIGASIIALLIILSSIFYFLKLKQSKKAELIALQLQESQKRLALEKQYRDSELKALKAQMNPHFIFNVLNSIQEFIILNQKEIASDYLAMFAELIRSYLHFSNQGFISLREETEALEKYLELESLRFGDTFTYRLKIDRDINLDGFSIPTMIIQPYIENAIKHGLFNKKKDRVLNIDFTQQEVGIIKCEITDNGIGRKKAQEIKASKTSMHKSFAMEATANRLELYNQKSHKKISLETIDLIDDEQNAMGTKVTLIIPSITK